ncbi:MAG: phasin family protein [Hyphomicrobiales bacterium]|nr:phasin family protein [Hyphomicrobiales bacterium]
MTASKKTVKSARKPAAKAAAPETKSVEFQTAARDYAHRAAEAALERATSIHAGAEKATSAIEVAASTAVESAAKAAREIQNAMFDDAKAAVAAFEKTIAAGSVGEAVRVQSDYYRAQLDVNVTRVKTVAGLVAEAAKTGAKTAQDNFARLGLKFGKAA